MSTLPIIDITNDLSAKKYDFFFLYQMIIKYIFVVKNKREKT